MKIEVSQEENGKNWNVGQQRIKVVFVEHDNYLEASQHNSQ